MEDLSYPVPDDVSLLPVYRAFGLCQQALDRFFDGHVEAMDLTPSQFDVLATLGDNPIGLTCREISDRSLVSSPTLTPVMGRMEAKGLLKKEKGTRDARQTIVSLTPEGQARYEEVFLPYVRAAKAVSDQLTPAEQAELVRLLDKLRQAFKDSAHPQGKGTPSPCM